MLARAPNAVVATILWRRLDLPGHDACRLERIAGGMRVSGMAVFQHAQGPAQLAYEVACDARWRARRGRVRGWIGTRALELSVARSAHGVWTVNGDPAPRLSGLLDFDLGFTPATNTLAMRRLALDIGRRAESPAAWLDIDAGTVDVLSQHYERRTERAYWYEAPRFDFAALLDVDSVGFVRRYGGLWEAA